MSDTPKVLIVDDDETSREYLSALLDALGFVAEGAASGRDALERLSRLPALDMVILDVIMPELDGVETQPLPDPNSHFGAGHQNIENVLKEVEQLGIPRVL